MEADEEKCWARDIEQPWANITLRHPWELLPIKPMVTNSSWFVWDLLGFSLKSQFHIPGNHRYLGKVGWLVTIQVSPTFNHFLERIIFMKELYPLLPTFTWPKCISWPLLGLIRLRKHKHSTGSSKIGPFSWLVITTSNYPTQREYGGSMGKPSELYLPPVMEAQVLSHLHLLTFYQNLDLDFRIGRDLPEHLIQPTGMM